ncbi:hypothetical protein [Streptomyces sp. NPDC050804]|uniref:hypothetical protein n=1 Tax=Streptomyces sp. NPDC050804 TaxID=3154745 RepID=UPI003437D56E
MTTPTNKWNLHTGGDLDAENGSLEDLTTSPPLTPAERLVARAAQVPRYGQGSVPPVPVPFTGRSAAGRW